MLENGSEPPGFDFPDISEVLPRLGKEGLQLEGEELAAIGRCILSGLKLKRARPHGGARQRFRAHRRRHPGPLGAFPRDLSHRGPRRAAAERQIPELAAIRERIRRHREDADRAVRGLLEEPTYRAYWQTTTPTQRDGRVVLPLKAQYKGRVKGIVHEMSASGSTVFIEPLEVVEKNNAIVQEENLYRMEVRRILRELTAEVSRNAGLLRTLMEHVAFLDVFLARARYAVPACLPQGGTIGRHALPAGGPPPPPGQQRRSRLREPGRRCTGS